MSVFHSFLPPLQKLPRRQMQLGHRDTGPRTHQAPEPRHWLQAPRQSDEGVAARDYGNDGRHGYQLN